MDDNNQNSTKSIRLLSAQSKSYSIAKIFSSLQIILAISSVIFTFLSIENPKVKSDLTFLSFLLLNVDFFILQFYIKKFREQGAKIQEIFDSIVLNIPLNTLKMGDPPKTEDVFETAKTCTAPHELKNWYFDKVQTLNSPFKEILSIRSNLYWDCFLRKKFMLYTLIIFLLIMFLVLFYAYSENKSFIESIALLIAPLSPFIALCYKIIFENKDAIVKIDKLYNHVDKILLAAKKGQVITQQEFRNIQDEIYEGRKRNILIPDFFHKIYKKNIEEVLYPILDEEVDNINNIIKDAKEVS